MKLTLAQINFLVADTYGNVELIKQACLNAVSQNSDIILFSEMCITGYSPADWLMDSFFLRRVEEALKHLTEWSKTVSSLGIVVGLPKQSSRGIVNAACFIHNGHILCEQHKSLLPYYDIFDEPRYFVPAEKWEIFEFKGKKIALTICEDAWALKNTRLDQCRIYAVNPMDIAARNGAQLILNLTASPFEIRKFKKRVKVFSNHAATYKIPIAMVNQVGGTDELVFDGGSFVFNEQGQLCALSPFFKEHLQTIDLNCLHPMDVPELEPMNLLYEALCQGLRDYVIKTGFHNVLIGLSGGIDSAVTAVLAVDALGAEHVAAVRLPSQYSSESSLLDAEELCRRLCVQIHTFSIASLYEDTLSLLEPVFKGTVSGLAEENIQSRLRGVLMMALSNKLGSMVITTGNKSELAVGYCTIYGDMNGGLNLIGDLYKTTVYELAKFLNKEKERIPVSIIQKLPSAELKPDQKDQDTLPEYDILDEILKFFLEENLGEKEIVEKGFEAQLVRFVIELVQKSEYKRKQAAPILKVSPKSFGKGRRVPIAAKLI
jgi:NAD+ synthase (glutamine-hydrolysing)